MLKGKSIIQTRYLLGVMRLGLQCSMSREEGGDVSGPYNKSRTGRCTIASVVCGGAGQSMGSKQ